MKYMAFIILLCLLSLCLLSIQDKSATFDELCHLPAGYSYLVTGDFRMNPEQPPLIKMLAALPLLFLDLKRPEEIKSWQGNDSYVFGQKFLYHSGQDADKILFWGRVPMILLSCLLGIAVFFRARAVFGLKAGIFAIFLYSFSPFIIAHSRLVTLDIGVSAFMFLALYALWEYFRKPGILNLVLTGVFLGLAFISKFNALILMPIFLILIFREIGRRKFLRALSLFVLVLALAVFIIWAGYGFKTGKLLQEKNSHDTFSRLTQGYPVSVQKTAYSLGRSIILPFPDYLKGLGWMYSVRNKQDSFCWGRNFRGAPAVGFLLAFLVKTPIPFLIFILAAVVAMLRKRLIFKKDYPYLWLPPLAIFAVAPYFMPALQLKYLLPAYPFLCVLISQIVNYGFLRRRVPRLIFLLLCAWYLLASVKIFPHYLAYFNEIIGGPKSGYRYFVDSNLDWGQDLKLLKKFQDKNNIEKLSLAYFGTASPDYYGIRFMKLQPFKPASGWVAISATYLQGVHTAKGGYDWLKSYEPQEKIGYSIFVYKLKSE